MTQGTIRWFSGAKGFGFITPIGGGEDVFLHHSAIRDYDHHGLADDQPVEFELGEGRKGPQAATARVL